MQMHIPDFWVEERGLRSGGASVQGAMDARTHKVARAAEAPKKGRPKQKARSTKVDEKITAQLMEKVL